MAPMPSGSTRAQKSDFSVCKMDVINIRSASTKRKMRISLTVLSNRVIPRAAGGFGHRELRGSQKTRRWLHREAAMKQQQQQQQQQQQKKNEEQGTDDPEGFQAGNTTQILTLTHVDRSFNDEPQFPQGCGNDKNIQHAPGPILPAEKLSAAVAPNSQY